MKIKKNSLVLITKGNHKGKKEKVTKIFKDYIYCTNIQGLSGKRKIYNIKISKSNIKNTT